MTQPMDEEARQRELKRIDDRLDMLANWLIQGRRGDDPDCADARRADIADLERRREAIARG